MTRVVVAGAGGFVGGRLVAELAARPGIEVVALVRKHRPWLDARQVELDLREPSPALVGELEGTAALVHLAGPSEVHAAAHPEQVLADTVAISTNLGVAAAEAGVARITYLSTTHVYGDQVRPGARITEDLRPEPRHPYAIARLASEHVLAGQVDELVAVRLTNSVGAAADPAVDRWTLLVNDLCLHAARTGRMRLLSDGSQWRDFVSLGDAARVVADLALGGGAPGTWNLGSGTPTTVRAVAGLVADAFEAITGNRPELDAPPEVAPVDAPVVDVSGLAAHGLVCATPLAAAVAETARFCVAHRDELARWGADG